MAKKCVWCAAEGKWVCGNPPDCGVALEGEEPVALTDGQVGIITMRVDMIVSRRGNQIEIDPQEVVWGADGGVIEGGSSS